MIGVKVFRNSMPTSKGDFKPEASPERTDDRIVSVVPSCMLKTTKVINNTSITTKAEIEPHCSFIVPSVGYHL